MKKQIFIILLLFIVCFSLVGCGNKDVENNESEQVSKVSLTEEENDDLVKIIEKIAPVDYLGKSFVTSELSNEEMLRLMLHIFGPRNSGFSEMNFTYLNKSIVLKYFDYDDLKANDITCYCGEVLATYNSSNDIYSWDLDYHYRNHSVDVYNQYIDSYKIDDKYMIEMYKYFPDLLSNSSCDEYNFYTTYNDAVSEENSLFTITDETDFASALEILNDNDKQKYTYTFILNEDGNYILTEYKIG